MSVDRGPKSLHEHNKSLLYSNRPKFKEDLRENIYVDKIRNDGLYYKRVNENELKKVLAQIRLKARREFIKELKVLAVSIVITLIFVYYLKLYLDQCFGLTS
ncbi:hypothetical protein RM553_11475 [Zunongwangia sp. F363]|uniref:Uncharacterized protein n=1 Tax=Autumnicola tepida TaxID=3075595 RepID=A0ABU3CB69_9FLAO|nr:hypothetical protein [Zunongwangia sp. F363]MDT0643452.1 hypothetical protein [Zunongwangia sp. F363]